MTKKERKMRDGAEEARLFAEADLLHSQGFASLVLVTHRTERIAETGPYQWAQISLAKPYWEPARNTRQRFQVAPGDDKIEKEYQSEGGNNNA